MSNILELEEQRRKGEEYKQALETARSSETNPAYQNFYSMKLLKLAIITEGLEAELAQARKNLT